MSEWSNVLVSKTGIPKGIEGSNPSLSAIKSPKYGAFYFLYFDCVKYIDKNVKKIFRYKKIKGIIDLIPFYFNLNNNFR